MDKKTIEINGKSYELKEIGKGKDTCIYCAFKDANDKGGSCLSDAGFACMELHHFGWKEIIK